MTASKCMNKMSTNIKKLDENIVKAEKELAKAIEAFKMNPSSETNLARANAKYNLDFAKRNAAIARAHTCHEAWKQMGSPVSTWDY